MRYCPYCLEKFTRDDLGFKCEKSGKIFARSTYKMWKKQGILPVCPGGFEEASCRGCKGLALDKRVCLKCESDLMPVMLQNDNVQIAIIGTQSSGKTVFINMLLKVMRDLFSKTGYGKAFLPVQASEGVSVNLMVSNMERGNFPAGTQANNVKARLYQCGSGNKKDVLTFFDGAGETFTNEQVQATLQRYVNVSDGIILLFDPTSIPEIKLRLSKRGELLPQLARVTLEDSLRGASLTYDRIKEWRHGEVFNLISHFIPMKISIPCAVVFSKFDLMFPMFSDGSRVRQPNKNLDPCSKFDDDDSRIVSSEIRGWLQSNGCVSFLNEIESDFKTVRYFGISSLGGSPGTATSPKTYSPHRIADPLLWLMNVNGVL